MKIERMIELLQIEHECVLRNSIHVCDRNCENCNLVQKDADLLEMYECVIRNLQKQIKPYESRAKLPCVCGRKYKETWYGFDGDKEVVGIYCPVCRRHVKGNSEIEAIRAWNAFILAERESNH